MTAARPVVLDNTVLSNFAIAGSSELLLQLWKDAAPCTTPSVMAEYRRGVAQGSVPEGAWQNLATIDLEPEELDLLKHLPADLGSGESSCLAVAIRRGGVLATDDLAARKIAASRGVTITGSVGILVGCVRKELVDLAEGNRLLAIMIEHGYHSPITNLDDFI